MNKVWYRNLRRCYVSRSALKKAIFFAFKNYSPQKPLCGWDVLFLILKPLSTMYIRVPTYNEEITPDVVDIVVWYS